MTDETPPDEESEHTEFNARTMELGPFGPWEERERGMFTEADRDHIAGTAEFGSPQARSNANRRVRQRTVDGVTDLAYLAQLDERQREKVFAEFREDGDLGDLRTAVSAFVEFLYLGLDCDEAWIGEALEDGIGNAEHRLVGGGGYYGTATVGVDIQVEPGYDVDEIEERFRAGQEHTLTPAEVGVLVREGRVDEVDIWNLSHGEAGAPPAEADSPNDEGVPINPTMHDRKWFAEDEDVDDLDLAGLWSDESDDEEE